MSDSITTVEQCRSLIAATPDQWRLVMDFIDASLGQARHNMELARWCRWARPPGRREADPGVVAYSHLACKNFVTAAEAARLLVPLTGTDGGPSGDDVLTRYVYAVRAIHGNRWWTWLAGRLSLSKWHHLGNAGTLLTLLHMTTGARIDCDGLVTCDGACPALPAVAADVE